MDLEPTKLMLNMRMIKYMEEKEDEDEDMVLFEVPDVHDRNCECED